jgi:hypothetical protein
MRHVLWGRVARWHIYKPKIPIWVTFLCLALEDVVVSFVHLVYFMALRYTYIVDIWYVWWLFGIFFPVWYLVPRKIWQSLPQFLSRKVEFNCVITLENSAKKIVRKIDPYKERTQSAQLFHGLKLVQGYRKSTEWRFVFCPGRGSNSRSLDFSFVHTSAGTQRLLKELIMMFPALSPEISTPGDKSTVCKEFKFCCHIYT